MRENAMEQEAKRAIQNAIDYAEAHICENLTLEELASAAHYSVSYFARAFRRLTGFSAMSYLTRRKLQYAIHALCSGVNQRIIDVALEYGFESHAGFCRTFRKQFGCSPSHYRLHIRGILPSRLNVLSEQRKGALLMDFKIIEMEPRAVVGYASRHTLPKVSSTHDIPVFWERLNLDCASQLTTLHRLFPKEMHCEYGVCYDAGSDCGNFTYLLGVGVPPGAKVPDPKLTKLQLPGGLYAVFSTPWVPENQYVAVIRELWQEIFDTWLPTSGYCLDENRLEFEYYDFRDHAWEHNGSQQMDIYLPIHTKS